MGKEKKSVNAELINNTLAYSMMSVWAVTGSFFLFYFTFIFAGFIRGSETIAFSNPPVVMSIAFFTVSAWTCYIGLKNGLELFTQWQRKWAIETEDIRILRLMDDTTVLDNDLEEILQEEAQLEIV